MLVIGDTGQHQGVDAGRPFEQMQDAGMRTSRLDKIMRQKDPGLLKAVEHLAKKETEIGVKMLADQGRIMQIPDLIERVQAIAKDYATRPDNTIIVSPDNRSRQEINQAVRVELQTNGTLAKDGQTLNTLAHRSDMTGADREWAARYHAGDVLKYTTGSKAEGLERGSYATVLATNARDNTVTVQRADGQSVTYDPKRLKGVNAYAETSREFATGERVQFTTSDKTLGVSNRDLGTVTKIDPNQITIRMDGKEERNLTFDPTKMRHLDHGYAVTSHSSQGLTERKVIANIDTEAARALINTRLGYVAFSRPSDDLRIYTNDAESLGKRLATEISKTAAVDFREKTHSVAEPHRRAKSAKPTTEKIEPQPRQSHIRGFADPNHRTAAIASDYVARPGNTVIVAPDQAERRELTQLIRADLRTRGVLTSESRTVPILIDRELSNRRIAANYAPGDIIHYRAGNPVHGIASNSAATVIATDAQKNLVTVQTADGSQVAYNPVHLKSQTQQSIVYKEESRELATGDRIQFTAPNKAQGIRTRDSGTVSAIAENNALSVRLDNGKTVELDPANAKHIEHGYAVDGQKAIYAERVLVSIAGAGHISREDPLYRAVSRVSQNTTIYVSDPGSVQEKVAAEKVHSQSVGRLVPDKAIDSAPNKAEFEKLLTPAVPAPSQERHLHISLGLRL